MDETVSPFDMIQDDIPYGAPPLFKYYVSELESQVVQLGWGRGQEALVGEGL